MVSVYQKKLRTPCCLCFSKLTIVCILPQNHEFCQDFMFYHFVFKMFYVENSFTQLYLLEKYKQIMHINFKLRLKLSQSIRELYRKMNHFFLFKLSFFSFFSFRITLNDISSRCHVNLGKVVESCML